MNINKENNYWVYKEVTPNLSIQETKSKVNGILDINYIQRFFIENWFKSYYDFYFLRLHEFRKILEENQEINSFFYKKTWKSITRISKKDFLWFIEEIFSRKSLRELSQEVILFLNERWINSSDFVFSFWDMHKLKYDILQDNNLKYFFMRLSSKNILSLNSEDFIKIFKKIWFEETQKLDNTPKIKDFFKENQIIYLEDLDDISILEFKNFFENIFIRNYFSEKWISKSFLNRENISQLWKDLWLPKYDYKEWLELFLREIKTYDNLISIWTTKEIRDFLIGNRACLYVLKELKLNYLQDFRFNHIQRFARRVWLK